MSKSFNRIYESINKQWTELDKIAQQLKIEIESTKITHTEGNMGKGEKYGNEKFNDSNRNLGGNSY